MSWYMQGSCQLRELTFHHFIGCLVSAGQVGVEHHKKGEHYGCYG